MSDGTSQDADDLWGLPLKEYLDSLKQQPTSEDGASDPSVPSRTEVESALKKIYDRSPLVSCSTFQDALGVASYPDEVLKLAEKGNRLSSCCVRLLQDYAQRCNGLFYYQYGYLGLRVLVLSISISFEKYACQKTDTTFDYAGNSLEELIYYLTANAAEFLPYKAT
ncbi:hypothetical protein FRC07_003014, partial [Ceratobasidium sp. 392]